MADIILSPLVGLIVDKLKSTINENISFLKGFKGKLRSLEENMYTIEAVLETAAKCPKKTKRGERWLQQLKDVLYDVEDLLDDIWTESSRRKEEKNHRSILRKVSNFVTSSPFDPLDYSDTIKNIEENLADLTKNMKKFRIMEKSVAGKEDNESKKDKWTEPTGKSINMSKVIERGDEKDQIVNFLLNEENNNLSILSIVGIGGLGKTTLAQMVCNDPRVKKKFDVKWAHVSFREFKKEKIIAEILGMEETTKTLEVLENELQEELKKLDKICLFVLDDIWDMNSGQWNYLKDLLINDNKGNKVLITTRYQQIANTACKNPFQLKPLSPPDCCWPLFEKFAKFDKDEHSNLLPIGKEIIKKCEGVPLAAITLGLMLSKKTKEHWSRAQNNETWSLSDPKGNDSNIMSTLKLSYDNLEPPVKSFFSYYAICDSGIDRERLTQMWIAQDFVEQKKEKPGSIADTNLEQEVANYNFEKLVSTSFFYNVKKNDRFQVTEFEVLDLFRDLALLVSRGYSNIGNFNTPNASPSTYYVALSGQTRELPESLLKSEKLRTFVWPCQIQQDGPQISNFKRLRVLDLRLSHFQNLPTSIGDLKHLRYLDLFWNERISELPSSIGRLYNLETLRVDKCSKLQKLPEDIRKLINLRNLYISSQQESLLPFERFSSLRTLHLVDLQNLVKFPELPHFAALETLGIFRCPKLCFSENDMKDLTNLRHLAIVGLPKVVTIPLGLQSARGKLIAICLSECEGLTTVPEWFTNLTSLRRLTIEGCPELIIRCTREGADWPKIRHVKEIRLDNVRIQPIPDSEFSNLPSSSSGYQFLRALRTLGPILQNQFKNANPSELHRLTHILVLLICCIFLSLYLDRLSSKI